MNEDQLEQETLAWLAATGYRHCQGFDMAPDGPAPAYLLDFLRFFVLFEDDGTLVKKIAGYHQFHAVRAAIEQVITASRPGGSQKGGVVWHTQGSGKSITMTCFAARVMREAMMENPTIVVITDRNDLDGQLFGVFSLSQDLLREQPVQGETRQDLRAKLANRPSGGIVFATIQKFMPGEDEDSFPVLSDRHNIVVIADEAHRTQYGFAAKLKTIRCSRPPLPACGDTLEESDAMLMAAEDAASYVTSYQVGYAQHLRDALPNATFVAFTGTPVSAEDRDTRAVFGDYIHIYDMQQARLDGATVAIYFESRLAKLGLKADMLPDIDAEVDELAERNLAVELLERLLEGEIKTRFATNVVQQNKFSELLANVILRYQNRAIETAQVMEELIAMAQKFKEAIGRGEELGLNADELAFYDALANNAEAVLEMGDEILKKIAHELAESLRKNISVDWSVRDSVRASLRLMVKRILRKYKYPPSRQEEAVQLVLEQAETLSAEWG